MNPWHGKRVASASQPSSPQGTNSRWLALSAMLTFQQTGVFVARTLDELFKQHKTPPRDRRLATELASETIRRQLSLDAVLAGYVVRPRESVEDDLWMLLQLGACQLLCLQHIPAHAAVHETVALCEDLGKPRAKGFVNGTLRSIEREIIRNVPQEGADRAARESAENLKLESFNEHHWPILVPRGGNPELVNVELARAVFTSPKKDPLEYISQVTSLPHWLIERWDQQIGDRDRIFNLGLWFTTPGRVSLRLNLHRMSRQDFLTMLEREGVAAHAGPLAESILLEATTAVSDLPGFQAGLFSVQDLSAMGATELLNPQPGESILDLCAAPGGKTCHIAERLNGTGRVVACDVSAERLQTVGHNVTRLQLKNVETFPLSADPNCLPQGPFDAALVDVPCSNTGVLGKRPEARWRVTPMSFRELIPLQIQILESALNQVKSDGRVVYSTCSIDREENEEVVRAVCGRRSDVKLISETTHWPGQPADGGYQALIQRIPE